MPIPARRREGRRGEGRGFGVEFRRGHIARTGGGRTGMLLFLRVALDALRHFRAPRSWYYHLCNRVRGIVDTRRRAGRFFFTEVNDLRMMVCWTPELRAMSSVSERRTRCATACRSSE